MPESLKMTVIGCDSACPMAGSATSSYLIEAEGHRIMLDLGSGSLSLVQKIIDFDTVGDIVLSHFHADHVADAPVAVYSRLVSMQLGRCREKLHFHALEDRGFEGEYSDFSQIDEGRSLQLGPVSFSFMRTAHPVPCLAMRLECKGRSLVYTADGGFTEDLAEFSKGADILLAECSFHPGKGEGSSAGHMNPASVSRLANAARAGKLVLTHLPIYGDRTDILESVRAQYDGRVLLAKPFLEVMP